MRKRLRNVNYQPYRINQSKSYFISFPSLSFALIKDRKLLALIHTITFTDAYHNYKQKFEISENEIFENIKKIEISENKEEEIRG